MEDGLWDSDDDQATGSHVTRAVLPDQAEPKTNQPNAAAEEAPNPGERAADREDLETPDPMVVTEFDDFEVIETNIRTSSAPSPKKQPSVRERCDCKR